MTDDIRSIERVGFGLWWRRLFDLLVTGGAVLMKIFKSKFNNQICFVLIILSPITQTIYGSFPMIEPSNTYVSFILPAPN